MRTDWPNGADVGSLPDLRRGLRVRLARRGRRLREPAEHAQRGALRRHARRSRGSSTILARHDIQATFYVPGDTAERHPDALPGDRRTRATRSAITATCTCAATRSTRARSARRSSADSRRSATPRRHPARLPLAVLGAHARDVRAAQEHGFAWDSSLMGDDRPYRPRRDARAARCTGASTTGRTCTGSRAAATRSPRRRRSWTRGWPSSSRRCDDRRHVTYTMHPEVIGRGYRAALLDRLIDRDAASAATCGSRRTAMWQPG